MRVVHVGFHLDRHGREPDALLEAWPTLTGTASATAGAGAEVVVVQPAHREATLRRDGVEYRFVEERATRLRRGTPGTRPVRVPARRTLDAVADVSPDLVHVNGLSVPHHVRRLKARLPAVRVLVQDHADRVPPAWRRPAARWGMRAYDGVAFTAREQAEPFVRAGLLPAGIPVFEVLEGSSDFAPEDPDEARRAEGLHGDPCLVWVGRLDPNKDPLAVLEGFAAAAKRLPEAHLWLCYQEAPLLAAVQDAIRSDPVLMDRVHLLGWRTHERVERLLQAADALVLGSHREGSGYAVIEAMACGTTPVVTDIPPFRRIVGDAGPLWTPGDPAAAAAGILRFAELDRPVQRQRVRERFDRSLSWAVIGRKLVDGYHALVVAPAGAAGAIR